MLQSLFSGFFRDGALGVIRPNRAMEVYGKGEPEVIMRLHDRWAEWELALNPDLKLGELYMDGRLTVEKGDIAGLLALLMRNLGAVQPRGLHKLVRRFRTLTRAIDQYNPASRSKDHVAHHYDLSGRLYELFLDADRQYSCAYFSVPGETLEEAQVGKKRHIAAKLHLHKPGLKVLDIGCGWGGLALDMARDCRADVLGKGLPWLVAEKDGQVLGYAYANWFKPRPAYRFSAEDSIYVADSARGMGVGRKLLAELAAQAEAAGVRKLLAVIGDSANAGSIGVHRALGFTDVGTMKSVGWKFGAWRDIVLMEKSLGAGDTTSPE